MSLVTVVECCASPSCAARIDLDPAEPREDQFRCAGWSPRDDGRALCPRCDWQGE